jgi:phage tail sheath protein FI
MPSYLSPGIYIEERKAGAGAIAAVSTSTMATMGFTPRGPEHEATLITSLEQYFRTFGEHWKKSYISFAVTAFFANGGQRLYMVRVTPSDAAAAACAHNSSASAAESTGRVLPDPATALDGTHYNINVAIDGGEAKEIDVTNDEGVGGSYALSAIVTNINNDWQKARFLGAAITDPILTLDGTHFNINLDIDDGGAADIDVTGDSGVGGSYALTVIAANINTAVGSTVCFVQGTKLLFKAGTEIEFAAPSANDCTNLLLGLDEGAYPHTYTSNTQDIVAKDDDNRLVFTSPTTGVLSEVEFSAPSENDCSNLLLGLAEGSYPHTYNGVAAGAYWDVDAISKGAWGNGVKGEIRLNEDYKSAVTGAYTKFDYYVYEKDDDDVYQIEEQYLELSFSDVDSARYAPNVINALSTRVDLTVGADGPDVPPSLKPVSKSLYSIGYGTGSADTFTADLVVPTGWSILPGSCTVHVDGGASEGGDADQGDGTGVISGTNLASGSVVNYTTGACTVIFNGGSEPSADTNIQVTYILEPTGTAYCELSGGADGSAAITRNDVTAPALAADLEGIYAFDKIEEPMQISIPDFCSDPTSLDDQIGYAENRDDCFVLAAVPMNYTPTDAAKWNRQTLNKNTSYCALYYPHLQIADPLNEGRPMLLPPVGHVAGVYARTDSNRNVGKAPGGIEDGKLNYCIGIERLLSKGERDVLYSTRINPFMDSSFTGRAVWGVRTLSLDSEWRYIQARRLFIFVKKSVFNATHWIVFENNGPGLWARIKTQIVGFLNNLYNDGYFAGNSPEEAFAVIVDTSNNPQGSIDAGFIVIDVYIAPEKPSEFVRIRFQQKTASAG